MPVGCAMVDNPRPDGVTAALLNAKVDTIIEMLAEYRAEQAEHSDRIRELETDSARLRERVGLFAVALAVGQLIGSALAAYIGAMR